MSPLRSHLITTSIAGVLAAGLLACGGSSAAQPDAAVRPEGWTDDSHGKDAAPNYDTVFPSGQVLRLDLTIAAADWQAALDDMTAMYGEFGEGGGGGGGGSEFPAEMIAACDGLGAGDSCSAPTPGGTAPGTCLAYGVLVCFPDMLISACNGKLVDDDCAPPPPPGGEAPSGTCQRSDGGTLACMIPFSGGGDMESDVNPIWIPAQVGFADQTWWQVGFRFKGNSTLWHTWETGGLKLPFKLDFDQFEEQHPEIADQRFWGFKQIAFANNARDDSYLREKVTGDLFREAGVPSPRRAFYRVYIDFGEGSVYFGLYTAAEVPDGPLFESQLGADGGNLYKPTGPVATWQLGIDVTEFEKQNHEDAADWSDIEAARTALHADRTDAAAWRVALEQRLDAEGFVRWLAINTVIEDWDTYGNSPHNYYLYGDPGDGGRLHWIPWDHNESFAAADGIFPPLPLDLTGVDDGWPLIRFLQDDPVYQELYYDCMADFVATGFAATELEARLAQEQALIAPYVVGAGGEVAPYTVLDSADAFAGSLDRLSAHIAARHQAVADLLAGR